LVRARIPTALARIYAKKKATGNGDLFLVFGGAEEDRTPDLRIANATLSQLSYRPKNEGAL